MKKDTRTITAENYRLYKANPDGFRLNWDSLEDCLAWIVLFYGDDRKLSVYDRQERGRGNRWKRRAGWKLYSVYSELPCGCGHSPCGHYGWLEDDNARTSWYIAPEPA